MPFGTFVAAITFVLNVDCVTTYRLHWQSLKPLCWNTDAIRIQRVQFFISDSKVMDITPEIIIQCVKLRKGKKIKTIDALIAVTAIANKLTLITRNTVDFNNIESIKTITLFQL
jgi:predicted nucleic acid-binding protein